MSSNSQNISSGSMKNNNNNINKPSIPSTASSSTNVVVGRGDHKSNSNDDDKYNHPELEGIPLHILKLQETQPTLNIMTCGDVSHGKSTLLAALSGEKTGKHSSEKKGNMTIRLGYTSCKIWKCLICPQPQCYFTTHSDIKPKKVKCKHCGTKLTSTGNNIVLMRHLSFVDVPGHAHLMQTMVSATCVSDASILVIDSSSKLCPGKQTAQHCEAINLLGLMREDNIIIAQNKIDLITQSRACINYELIRKYLSNFGKNIGYNSSIIPISAQSQLNIDALCHSIIYKLPKYSLKLCNKLMKDDLRINIIRSFDINRAKTLRSYSDIDTISGGVIGGAVLSGEIEIGQLIEIRPGYIKKKQLKNYGNNNNNIIKNKLQPQWDVQPIITRVISLKYGKRLTNRAYPGGNVGIQTNIDPSLSKSDIMVGHIVINHGSNNIPPPIFNTFIMSYVFLRKQKDFRQFEEIKINIGAWKMKAEILHKKVFNDYNGVLVVLEAPICASIGDQIGICRTNKEKEWSFVAGGIIRKVRSIYVESDQQRIKQYKLKFNQNIINNNLNGGVFRASDNNDIVSSIIDVNNRVHISYKQRTSRKGITIIVGLAPNISLKKLCSKMQSAWSTGGSIKNNQKFGVIIQLNGDFRIKVKKFLIQFNIVDKSKIVVHGY